jgi:nicotinate-nucleotide--dimethylbenzimidazole phosphoribosyltransferase
VHVGIRVAADENGYVDPLLLLPPAAGAPAQPDAAETPEQSMPEGESSDAPSPTPDETALPAEAETAESGPDADLGASASSSVQGEHAQTVATVSSGQVATEPQPAAAPAPEAASQANAVSETAIEPSLEPQPQVGEPEKGAGSPSLQVGAGGPSQAVDFAVVAPSTATERTRRVDRAKTGDAPSSGARTTAARAAGEPAREAGGARHGRPTVPSSDGPDTAARTLGAHSGAGSAGDPTGQEDGEVPGQDRALRVSAGAALAAAALAGVVLLLWRPLSGSSRTPRDHPVPGRPGGAVTPAEAGESVAGTAAPDTPGRHLPLPAPPLIAAESQIVRLRSVEQLADAA